MANQSIHSKRSAQPVRFLSIHVLARRLCSDERTISKALQAAGRLPDGFTDGGQRLFRADRLEAIAALLGRPIINSKSQ